MNLAEIETFLTIVNTKNITKTAETLFLSQPTVSHRLTSLENELNFSLVIRKKGCKQVEITPRGLEFVPVAERWVSLWKETQAIRRSTGRVQVTVGCTDSVNNALFYPFYVSILDSDTPLDITIRTHQSSELYEILNTHDIDVGFVYHSLHYKNVISEMLLEERLYLVQSGTPAIRKSLVHTDELNASMELFLRWDNNYQIWHDRWFAESESPHFRTDAITMLNRVWTRPEQWLIAPESVIMELSRFRPLYVSEVANTPPRRVCYRIRHRSPKLGNRKAVAMFNQLLDDYVTGIKYDIPIGTVWGGHDVSSPEVPPA